MTEVVVVVLGALLLLYLTGRYGRSEDEDDAGDGSGAAPRTTLPGRGRSGGGDG
ncbi:hypothetical protein [Streptomyces sp. HNM0574]|uniref:hypothetical protein n=1 Tax=Streptomyces sp. HNM0574 TaxID=2714954 RepID=UPI00146D2AF3|nr:hypothetical protein [Streptomyces sp. HNM0574]NLU70406.1 hypothetical protein [Streptomyces sp. HNM0574]